MSVDGLALKVYNIRYWKEDVKMKSIKRNVFPRFIMTIREDVGREVCQIKRYRNLMNIHIKKKKVLELKLAIKVKLFNLGEKE